MPDESREQLREALQELREQIDSGEPVDPELRDLLEGVVGDLHGLLDAGKPEQHGPLARRVEQMALEFETSHPMLAGTLNRLTHMLSSMGI